MSFFWMAVALYATAGLVFAIPFLGSLINRLDNNASAGTWGFRLAILPGVVVFWPLLLAKTQNAAPQPPDAEAAASTSSLRAWHGRAWVFLVAVVPLVGTGALWTRPSETASRISALQPALLPTMGAMLPVTGLPISVAVRTDGVNDQVQFDVSQPLEEPVVAAYWIPDKASFPLPGDAVFLGSVWGPHQLILPLPAQNHRRPGTLILLALSGDQRVLATVPLP